MLKRIALPAAIACGTFFWTSAMAQAKWPEKPIRMIVPWAPGGVADVLARQAARVVSASIGQPVVVENKPGAGSNIGADLVAKSKPDGYTLLFASSTNAINMTLFPRMSYDVQKDLAPVAVLFSVPNALVVNKAFPAKTVADFISYARAQPDGIAYATPGPGSPAHLAGEQFGRMTGIKMRHVGYQGGTPAMSDVMAGHVPVAFMNLTAVQPALESGKVRVLAVGSAKRVPSLPNVPTLAESGVVGFESTSWMGLMAPAGTPSQVIERVQQALAGMQATAVVEFARKQGVEPAVSTPDQMRAILKADVANYGKVIRQAGISAD